MWNGSRLSSLLPVEFPPSAPVSLTLSTTVSDSSLIIVGTASFASGTSVSLSLAEGTPVSLSLPRFNASLSIFVHKGLFWPSQSH